MRRLFTFLLAGFLSIGSWLVPVTTSLVIGADAPAISPEAKAREMIETTFRSNVALHGAWIMLNPIVDSDPLRFELTVIVDSARTATQLPEVEKLIQKLPLNPPPVRGPVYRLPLANLLTELRQRAKARFEENGTFIQGAYYKPGDTDDVVKLVIYGRYNEGIDKQRIIDECDFLMKQDAWKALLTRERAKREITIQPIDDALKIRMPSEKAFADEAQLRKGILADPALRGAWVELVECFDQDENFFDYDVYVVVDSAFANRQIVAVRKLLKQQLSRPYKIVEVRNLPLSDLVAKINLNLETNSKYSGCYVESAHYAPKSAEDSDGMMVLNGRVSRQEQADLIKNEICIPLMNQDPIWKPYVEEFLPETREMAEVLVSYNYAKGMFSSGLEQFWQRRYAEAEVSFRYACVDAPQLIEYRYWQIVTLLKMGRTKEAYEHISALERRGLSNETYMRVQRSLQRVQGSIRTDIIDMENRARQELYLHQRTSEPTREKPDTTASIFIR